ncbi:hypothetical protein [Streptomyces sp. NPDC052179]|uniref:hypothetical protein n=1 Tax=Streptomyces sp. NPDC052179 TaxID=3155680 RepID=UPI0034478644
MRASIRQNTLPNLHDDVEAAMALVDIDDSGTYRRVLVTSYPDRPSSRVEEVMPGREVRLTLRVELLTCMHEVKQSTPTAIEARWSRQSKRNDYRTRTSTYTRIPSASLNCAVAPPAPPSALLDEDIPAHVTATADYIELVAEAGDAEDALDLSRQLIHEGRTKVAIDVRRTVTRSTLDRNTLRKIALAAAAQARREYREARLLRVADPA